MKRTDANFFHWVGSTLSLILLFMAGCATHGDTVSGPDPSPIVDLGTQTQLFLHDQRVVASSEGLELVAGRPQKWKGNPVLVADRPWEHGNVGYASVLYDEDEKVYKMWYESRLFPGQIGQGGQPAREQGRLLYATSRDGLSWDKPLLHRIASEGSRANNIVFTGPEGMRNKAYWVIKDYAEPDPARRYKMMFHLWDFGGRGVSIAHSPDGIAWTSSRFVNLHGGFDTLNILFWDARIGQYAGYFRGFRQGRRQIARSLSPDAYHWSEPVIVHGPDEQDPEEIDLYTPGIFPYRKAKDVYIMLTAAFNRMTDQLAGQLAVSRDGIQFHRFRDPVLPNEPGQWDAGSIYPLPSEVMIEGREALYYFGNKEGHGAGEDAGIGVALLQEGAFVGREARESGMLTTNPLRPGHPRGEFALYASAARGGIQAELLETDGSPVPGFEREKSRSLKQDGPRQILGWEGNPNLEEVVRSRPVRLRLHLDQATVYGLQWVRSSARPTQVLDPETPPQ